VSRKIPWRKWLTQRVSALKPFWMADWFYFVTVALDEASAVLDSNQLLVQLVCEDHACSYEIDRESSACRVAVDFVGNRYPPLTEIG
jgi:hypothetical protein